MVLPFSAVPLYQTTDGGSGVSPFSAIPLYQTTHSGSGVLPFSTIPLYRTTDSGRGVSPFSAVPLYQTTDGGSGVLPFSAIPLYQIRCQPARPSAPASFRAPHLRRTGKVDSISAPPRRSLRRKEGYRGGSAQCSGKSTDALKRSPSISRVRRPPMRLASCSAIERPRPLPSVVRDLSERLKRSNSSSGDMLRG